MLSESVIASAHEALERAACSERYTSGQRLMILQWLNGIAFCRGDKDTLVEQFLEARKHIGEPSHA